MTASNRGRRFPPEPLTDSEVWALIGAAKGSGPVAARSRGLVAVLWGAGLRISEALSLCPRDIHDGSILVRCGKGGRHRVAGLRPEAYPLLQAWLQMRDQLGLTDHQPVFCTLSDGRSGHGVRVPGQPLDSSYARRLLPRLARKAGISKRTHPHCLRHSHATGLVERGVALHLISQQLGHSSAATTDSYLAKVAPIQRLAALQHAWAEPSSTGSCLGSTEKRVKFRDRPAPSCHAPAERDFSTTDLDDRELIAALLARLITPTPSKREVFAIEDSPTPIQGIPYP